jgi:ribosomal protein L16/L10AE
MKDFEDFGRWLDEEVQRVRQVIETDIKPTAEKKCISALKTAAKKLSSMAEELEKKTSRKSA